MRRILTILMLIPMMIMLAACDGLKIRALKYEQFNLMQKTINNHFGPWYRVISYHDEETLNANETELTVAYRLSVDRPLDFRYGSSFSFDVNFGYFNDANFSTQILPRTRIRGNMIFQKQNGAWTCIYNTITDPENWEGVVKTAYWSAGDQGVSTKEEVYHDDSLEADEQMSEEYYTSQQGKTYRQIPPQTQRPPDISQPYGSQRPRSTTPGGPTSQTVYAVTDLSSFVTSRPGARAGSGASASSTGSGTFNTQAASGFSASFDPNATSGFDSSVSSMPRVTHSGIETPDITKTPEPVVKIPKPASSAPDADIIYNQISARRGQIENAYKRNAAVKKQTGSITVLMDIAENGSVSARVTSNSSTFTQSFMNEIKSIVESWSLNVSKPTKYQFRMNLTQA